MVQIGTEKSQGYDYGRSHISLLIYEWGAWPSPPSYTTTHSLSVSVRGWRRMMPEVAAPPAEAASFRRPLYLFQLLLMAGADALCLITPLFIPHCTRSVSSSLMQFHQDLCSSTRKLRPDDSCQSVSHVGVVVEFSTRRNAVEKWLNLKPRRTFLLRLMWTEEEDGAHLVQGRYPGSNGCCCCCSVVLNDCYAVPPAPPSHPSHVVL